MLMVLIGIKAFGDTPTDSARVLFRVGYSQYDPALGDNRAVMDSFIEQVRKAYEANEIDSIVVRAYASPDGVNQANVRLSRLRCNTIRELIIKRADIDATMIRSIPEGVAWGELRRMVYENPNVPSRSQILEILDNVPLWIFNSKGAIVDGRKKRLMELDNGQTYRWLLNHIFPQLRNAVAVALYTKNVESAEHKESSDHTEHLSSSTDGTADTETFNRTDNSENIVSEVIISEDIEISEGTGSDDLPGTTLTGSTGDHKPFYMAVKNNMLYDAALVPNLGVEFYLGKDLSLYGEWMYAWWEKDARHRYWQINGGDIGLRWWFGRKAHAKPLTGHHLGIYCGAIIFDFEFGETGYMGGKPGGTILDRCLVNAGIEYGYSLPVAKRLNIDFSIGLGYLGGNYIKYFPFDNDYYREKEYKMRYFGPTKAEISLIWLIGRGNTNQRKGGGK